MADVKWVKITTDMFNNRKIKHLRRLPEGNSIVLIWVMLLTMAGRCNAGGMIFLTENIPYTTKMLADELEFEESTVILALNALERFNMISQDGEAFRIAGWEEYQNIEGLDRIREQTRRRVAAHREKKAALMPCNATCNVTVTQSNAIDKEEEREEEGEGEEEDIQVAVPAEPPVKKRSKAFQPPTVEEVRDYCIERENVVDPETFVDFYASKGWMVGKTKMKDWKAAVRTWERSEGRGVKSNGGYHKSTVKSNAGRDTPTEGMGTWL